MKHLIRINQFLVNVLHVYWFAFIEETTGEYIVKIPLHGGGYWETLKSMSKEDAEILRDKINQALEEFIIEII